MSNIFSPYGLTAIHHRPIEVGDELPNDDKTIGNVGGSYRLIDSETDKIVLVQIADLFNNGDIAMAGTTNTSV